MIQAIDIRENRFGFEPEVIAKVADMRCRVYEMGISYRGRTYEEGKKIGVRDGLRALYCIVRYNAHRAPLPMQFMFYLLIGGTAAAVNLLGFIALRNFEVPILGAAISSCIVAALVNYWLCINTIFRHRSKWGTLFEYGVYTGVVMLGTGVDATVTLAMVNIGSAEWVSKLVAIMTALVVNFAGRRFWVFPEGKRGPWKTSNRKTQD